jgi:hypothetical protein
MLSFKMFAAVMAMMIVAVSAAAVNSDLAQAASIGAKEAVHAAASGVSETSEKADIAATGMASSMHDAARVERGGYGGYPYHPWYPPYPVYYGKGKGKDKWKNRAYNVRESGDIVVSGDMEASVHDSTPVERGGYGGYPAETHMKNIARTAMGVSEGTVEEESDARSEESVRKNDVKIAGKQFQLGCAELYIRCRDSVGCDIENGCRVLRATVGKRCQDCVLPCVAEASFSLANYCRARAKERGQ